LKNCQWYPHPGPQQEFCSRWEYEALYGGSAGGGKTDALIMEALRDVGQSSYRGLILRRTFPQLQEILDRTRQHYPLLGGEYRAGTHRWHFPSGATVSLGHIQNEGDEYNYQGHEYGFLAFDEAGQFSPKQYLYLQSRCRSTNPKVKPRVRAATNPGGVGHQFLKERFRIGHVEPGTSIQDPVTGLSRVFIPAKFTDNPSLTVNDPDYVRRLMQLPEIERLRLMEGVWDAFEGQVFAELSTEIHGIEPFPLIPEWTYFRTFDWGYAAPWVCIWWAVDFDGRLYIVKIAYGAKWDDTQSKNVGVRQSDVEIAREIMRVEREELRVKVLPGPADPSIWSKKVVKRKTGTVVGPPTAEEMAREGVHWLPADNDRLAGKRQFHLRLRLDEEGKPGMYVFNDAAPFWTTIPLLREDPRNIEDVDTRQEDHCFVADTPVITDSGVRPIASLEGNAGHVLTVGGFWVPYFGCYARGMDKDLLRVVFEDGFSVYCTSDHRFMAKNVGWVEAKDLWNIGARVIISETIKEDPICESPLLTRQSRSFLGRSITSVGSIFNDGVDGYTGQYGNITTGPSREEPTSTTRMGTDQTTRLKTSRRLPSRDTQATTENERTTRLGSGPCTMGPQSGTDPRLEGRGTPSTTSESKPLSTGKKKNNAISVVPSSCPHQDLDSVSQHAGQNGGATTVWTTRQEHVRSVRSHSEQVGSVTRELVQEIVAASSGGARCVKVRRVEQAGRATVYCLVAAGTHVFALGNGVFVSNCYDAVRYGLMFRPIKPKVQPRHDTGSFQAERRKLIKAKAYAQRYGTDLSTAYGRVR
jgi:hypothetical protein